MLSNADTDLFRNTPCCFTNRIPLDIDLQNYNVALAEISFPFRKSNIQFPVGDRAEILCFDFLFDRGKINGNQRYGKWYKGNIDLTKTHTPQLLATELNKFLLKYLPRLRPIDKMPFTYNEKLDRIYYQQIPQNFYTCLVKGFLIQYIGLAKDEEKEDVVALGKTKRASEYTYKGEKRYFGEDDDKVHVSKCVTRNFFKYPPLNSLNSVRDIMVCANVASLNYVGSKLFPHLRTISVDINDMGKIVCKSFKKLFYYKMSSPSVTEIRIELKSLNGDFLQLGEAEDSHTRCVLHFSPKQ